MTPLGNTSPHSKYRTCRTSRTHQNHNLVTPFFASRVNTSTGIDFLLGFYWRLYPALVNGKGCTADAWSFLDVVPITGVVAAGNLLRHDLPRFVACTPTSALSHFPHPPLSQSVFSEFEQGIKLVFILCILKRGDPFPIPNSPFPENPWCDTCLVRNVGFMPLESANVCFLRSNHRINPVLFAWIPPQDWLLSLSAHILRYFSRLNIRLY